MTKEELELHEQVVNDMAAREIKHIRLQYAKANQLYKCGEILVGRGRTIRVENIRYNLGENPQAVYYGSALRKDLQPRKVQETIGLWQEDVKEKIR